MTKGFKYDVIQLIHAIRDRPCLWDKTIESYKDRIERRNAWEDIFNMLDGSYNNMSFEDKRMTGEYILNKWTNIRDTFVKTLKSKMGKPKKKYLLYEHLKFLMKIFPEEEPSLEINIECPVNENIDRVEESLSFMKEEVSEPETSPKANTIRKKKKTDYNEDAPKKKKSRNAEKHRKKYENDEESCDTGEIDFVEVDAEPRLMNEDEAFFASLLPTVVKYSEDERLEFRIEVLAVMKKIKDNRKWSAE